MFFYLDNFDRNGFIKSYKAVSDSGKLLVLASTTEDVNALQAAPLLNMCTRQILQTLHTAAAFTLARH